jgi:hypothetical protein
MNNFLKNLIVQGDSCFIARAKAHTIDLKFSKNSIEYSVQISNFLMKLVNISF